MLVPAMALANIVGVGHSPCTGDGCDYRYVLTLAGLSSGQEDTTNLWAFSFDWVGPYRFNSPNNSLLPGCCAETGSPKVGGISDGGPGGALASVSSTGSDNDFIHTYWQLPTAVLSDPSVDYLGTGSDSFWVTLGTQSLTPALR
jgi:hypothetical protein